MKPIIKIFPEIMGFIPALSFPKKGELSGNRFYLDFSNCFEVDSSGLNILLLHLLKILKGKKTNKQWYIDDDFEKSALGKKLFSLNFFNILSQYFPQSSLQENKLLFPVENSHVPTDHDIIKMKSFPIFSINFDASYRRRQALSMLRKWLFDILNPLYQIYDFNLPQLISIINEIAKNSADHTIENAFIGLDIEYLNNQDFIKIRFSIGDLGVGINQNIKNHLPEYRLKRKDFWDLTQTYFEALTDGFTTKQNSDENAGLGMSVILDGAKNCPLNLSVFDANSRGLLSRVHNEISHGEIRRNFYNLSRDLGFYYFGELKAKKIL